MRSVLLALLLLVAPLALAQPGALDPTFGGGDGFVATDIAGNDLGEALALQPDGKILLAGSSALVRYLPDGTLDPTFGEGGIVSPTGANFVTALALQPDGKVLIGGYRYPNALLGRYLPDGTPDPTFGDGGIILSAKGCPCRPSFSCRTGTSSWPAGTGTSASATWRAVSPTARRM